MSFPPCPPLSSSAMPLQAKSSHSDGFHRFFNLPCPPQPADSDLRPSDLSQSSFHLLNHCEFHHAVAALGNIAPNSKLTSSAPAPNTISIQGVSFKVFDPNNICESDLSSVSSRASSETSSDSLSLQNLQNQTQQAHLPCDNPTHSPAPSAPQLSFPTILVNTDQSSPVLKLSTSAASHCSDPAEFHLQAAEDANQSPAIESPSEKLSTVPHQERSVASPSPVIASSFQPVFHQNLPSPEQKALFPEPQDFALVYGCESSSSPASAHMSRRVSHRVSHAASYCVAASPRRVLYDAGVQPEPLPEIRRPPALSTHADPRRNSTHTGINRLSDMYGFIIVGRTVSGAHICDSDDGRTFHLVIDVEPSGNFHSAGVQCLPEEILSEMEHAFAEPCSRSIGIQTGIDSFPTPYRSTGSSVQIYVDNVGAVEDAAQQDLIGNEKKIICLQSRDSIFVPRAMTEDGVVSHSDELFDTLQNTSAPALPVQKLSNSTGADKGSQSTDTGTLNPTRPEIEGAIVNEIVGSNVNVVGEDRLRQQSVRPSDVADEKLSSVPTIAPVEVLGDGRDSSERVDGMVCTIPDSSKPEGLQGNVAYSPKKAFATEVSRKPSTAEENIDISLDGTGTASLQNYYERNDSSCLEFAAQAGEHDTFDTIDGYGKIVETNDDAIDGNVQCADNGSSKVGLRLEDRALDYNDSVCSEEVKCEIPAEEIVVAHAAIPSSTPRPISLEGKMSVELGHHVENVVFNDPISDKEILRSPAVCNVSSTPPEDITKSNSSILPTPTQLQEAQCLAYTHVGEQNGDMNGSPQLEIVTPSSVMISISPSNPDAMVTKASVNLIHPMKAAEAPPEECIPGNKDTIKSCSAVKESADPMFPESAQFQDSAKTPVVSDKAVSRKVSFLHSGGTENNVEHDNEKGSSGSEITVAAASQSRDGPCSSWPVLPPAQIEAVEGEDSINGQPGALVQPCTKSARDLPLLETAENSNQGVAPATPKENSTDNGCSDEDAIEKSANGTMNHTGARLLDSNDKDEAENRGSCLVEGSKKRSLPVMTPVSMEHFRASVCPLVAAFVESSAGKRVIISILESLADAIVANQSRSTKNVELSSKEKAVPLKNTPSEKETNGPENEIDVEVLAPGTANSEEYEYSPDSLEKPSENKKSTSKSGTSQNDDSDERKAASDAIYGESEIEEIEVHVENEPKHTSVRNSSERRASGGDCAPVIDSHHTVEVMEPEDVEYGAQIDEPSVVVELIGSQSDIIERDYDSVIIEEYQLKRSLRTESRRTNASRTENAPSDHGDTKVVGKCVQMGDNTNTNSASSFENQTTRRIRVSLAQLEKEVWNRKEDDTGFQSRVTERAYSVGCSGQEDLLFTGINEEHRPYVMTKLRSKVSIAPVQLDFPGNCLSIHPDVLETNIEPEEPVARVSITKRQDRCQTDDGPNGQKLNRTKCDNNDEVQVSDVFDSKREGVARIQTVSIRNDHGVNNNAAAQELMLEMLNDPTVMGNDILSTADWTDGGEQSKALPLTSRRRSARLKSLDVKKRKESWSSCTIGEKRIKHTESANPSKGRVSTLRSKRCNGFRENKTMNFVASPKRRKTLTEKTSLTYSKLAFPNEKKSQRSKSWGMPRRICESLDMELSSGKPSKQIAVPEVIIISDTPVKVNENVIEKSPAARLSENSGRNLDGEAAMEHEDHDIEIDRRHNHVDYSIGSDPDSLVANMGPEYNTNDSDRQVVASETLSEINWDHGNVVEEEFMSEALAPHMLEFPDKPGDLKPTNQNNNREQLAIKEGFGIVRANVNVSIEPRPQLDGGVRDKRDEVQKVDLNGEEETAKKPKRNRCKTQMLHGSISKQSRRRTRQQHKLKAMEVEKVDRNRSASADNIDMGVRRSQRQRFPRLKFWKNETVRYERRLSQVIPTIAQVVVDVGESDSENSWFHGRR